MEILYYNGIIFTGETFVNSFVVENGRFKNVQDMHSFDLNDYDECIDLHQQFVCAGFNDSHMHLLSYGQSLQSANLIEHTSSLHELIEYGKSFLASHPISNHQWLQGRGWNQDYFQDVNRMPTKDDLDTISKEIPILFMRTCGHACVVNSKALELANITKETKDILGGTIGRNEDGTPNGLFFDNAIDFITSHIPLPSKQDLKEMILTAVKSLNQFGITSVQSDDYSLFREIPFETVNDAYRQLIKENKLSIRVYEQWNFNKIEELKRFIEDGNRTGQGNDFFQIGPLKMLGDGSLGSHTAYLSRPYHDEPSTQGFTLFSDEQMNEMVDYANKNDMQIAIHAIGDGCLDQVLNALDLALQKHPRINHRHGIVHTQITRKDQLERIAQMNYHCYIQSIFLDYDNHIIHDRVDSPLSHTSYNWKTLLDKGVHLSNGSDAPVEIPDVMKGIQCAITRTSMDGTGPYLLDQAFTMKEALLSFTKEGAYASFEEEKKGFIKDYYLADFVVLSSNPFTQEAQNIHRIKVVQTYVDGRCVYQAE